MAGQKLRLMADNDENSRETPPCWTDRALLPEDAFRETTEPGSTRSMRRWPAGRRPGLSALFVADSHWRNLFGISWHFATFSGNARWWPNCWRAARRPAPPISGSIRRARAAPRRGRRPRGGRGDLRLRHGQRPGLRRRAAAAPAGRARRKPGPFPPRSISMRSARRARGGAPRHPHIRDFAGPDWLEAAAGGRHLRRPRS